MAKLLIFIRFNFILSSFSFAQNNCLLNNSTDNSSTMAASRAWWKFEKPDSFSKWARV